MRQFKNVEIILEESQAVLANSLYIIPLGNGKAKAIVTDANANKVSITSFLTPQELDTLLQPLNEATEAANEAAIAANNAAQNAVTGSQSLGTITPPSTIPAEGNVWGFAGEGTYPNAGNITVEAGKFAILSRVGTEWSKVEIPIDALSDGSVTPEKTSFVEEVIQYGKNRFNKNAITSGKRVNEVWGNIYDAAGWSVSEFIPVDDLQGENIALSYLFQVAFYTDANESSFISGENMGGLSNQSVLVPSNAKYAVFSIENPFIDVFQVEEGTSFTSYEEYQTPKTEVVIPSLKIQELEPNSITVDKTDFAESILHRGKNILNPQKKINGKGLVPDGSYYDEPLYYIFDKLPIQGGKIYSSTHVSYASFYDANDNFIERPTLSGIFTTPSNAAYASFMVSNNFANPQIEIGGIQTPYEAYFEEQRTIINLDSIRKVNDVVEIGDKSVKEVRVHGIISATDHEIYRNDRVKQNLFIGGAGLETYDTSNQYFYGNVAAGYRALAKCNASMTNVAIGNYVLEDFGEEVNENEVVGADCTGVGDQVMRKLKSGVGNSGFGKLSLAHGTFYTNCSAYGDTSLEFNNSNSNNAFGYSAGIRLKYGSGNCLFGTFAGGTAIPGMAFYSDENYMAHYNNCNVFGNATMQFNLHGDRLNIFGTLGAHEATASDLAGFGHEVFRNAHEETLSAAFGNYAGWRVVNGQKNIFLGHLAGGASGQKTNAVNTVAIGYGAITTKDNQVVIGNNTNDEFVICGVTFTKAQLQALKNLV